MQIPLINQVKLPVPKIVSVVAAAILGMGATTYLVSRYTTSQVVDISNLVTAVTSQTLTVQVQVNGRVRPNQTVNISPKTAGRLAKIYVKQGDYLKQGDIIARMEDEEIQSQVMQAQANLNRLQARLAELKAGNLPEEIAQARSRLTQAESSLTQLQTGSRIEEIGQAQAQLEAVQVKKELAQKRVKRYEYLVAQGAIAQDKLDEALSEEHHLEANVKQLQYHLTQLINGPRHQEIIKATAAVTEARYALQQLQNGTRPEMIAQAQAAVDEAYAQLQTVKARARDTVVRSPFAGLITQRYADPGAFVTPTTSASSSASATSTSIVALAAGLEILAEVPEADINQIQLGQKVEITSDAYPKQVFMGSVRLIAPEAVRNQNVTLFQVQVQIDTGKDKLRSGMNVELTFLGNQIPNATVVPSVAVLTQNGRVGVLVPDQNNQPQFKPVTVGVIVGNQTQIIQGVKIGDKVFIDYPEKSN